MPGAPAAAEQQAQAAPDKEAKTAVQATPAADESHKAPNAAPTTGESEVESVLRPFPCGVTKNVTKKGDSGSPNRHKSKAGDRIRTGDVQLGKFGRNLAEKCRTHLLCDTLRTSVAVCKVVRTCARACKKCEVSALMFQECRRMQKRTIGVDYGLQFNSACSPGLACPATPARRRPPQKQQALGRRLAASPWGHPWRSPA
jgi:hypothetical protein